tara:strand:- start:1609 stop:1920 length:312 start_codon:yes stop_codon:yes gene_type:complete
MRSSEIRHCAYIESVVVARQEDCRIKVSQIDKKGETSIALIKQVGYLAKAPELVIGCIVLANTKDCIAIVENGPNSSAPCLVHYPSGIRLGRPRAGQTAIWQP